MITGPGTFEAYVRRLLDPKLPPLRRPSLLRMIAVPFAVLVAALAVLIKLALVLIAAN